MEHLKKALILLLVAWIPAAAPPFSATTPAPVASHLCFTAGSLTYEVAPETSAPDFRVRFAATTSDLRIQLVDSVDLADFALVDDIASDAGACRSAGDVKTVQIVGEQGPADVTVSFSRGGTPNANPDENDADLKLFVHSARFGHRDAAALFAALRHFQTAKLAQSR
jgi:hypothetical protein